MIVFGFGFTLKLRGSDCSCQEVQVLEGIWLSVGSFPSTLPV